MIYKVLTLWEPWATLVVTGEKKIETRPRPTTWIDEKGIYLIHSANKWTKEQRIICMSKYFSKPLIKIYDWSKEIPFHFGHIIGSVEVKECIKIPDDFKSNKMFKFILANCGISLDEREVEFGDYSKGRYAWILQNPRILKTPIPYKGGQGYYQNFKGDEKDLIFR